MASVQFRELGAIQGALDVLLKPSTPAGNWLLVNYVDDNTITFQASGKGGVEELLEKLDDNQVQFALIRISDVKAGAPVTRDVFINWNGPSLSKIKIAKKKAHLADVQKLLSPNHGQLEAIGRKNFTEETIRVRSGPGTGSHVIE